MTLSNKSAAAMRKMLEPKSECCRGHKFIDQQDGNLCPGCLKTFCDNCYDDLKGDGCVCHGTTQIRVASLAHGNWIIQNPAYPNRESAQDICDSLNPVDFVSFRVVTVIFDGDL